MKRRIAERVSIDATTLPYRQEVLDLIHAERAAGRRVVLATASDQRLAQVVSDHLGLFDNVLASDGQNNLSGLNKLDAIRRDAGDSGFRYVGDRPVDLHIWREALGAIVVTHSSQLVGAAARVGTVERVIEAKRATLRDLLYGIRLHQWLKNLLVILPVLPLLGSVTPAMLLNVALAFVAFGLSASSIYLINDLLDLEADRRHHRKRLRPFAAGRISVKTAMLLSAVLLGASWAIALALLPALFSAVLAIYIVVTTVYSIALKRRVLVDAFTLAGLYTLRILAGAAAIQVAPSFWILSFSLFAFLSLALAKRYVELETARKNGSSDVKDRGYSVEDQQFVMIGGLAAGQISVLVLSLYLNDPVMVQKYRHPYALWIISPLFLYWIIRVWLKARRNELHDDPVVFAATDGISRVVALLCFAAIAAAFWTLI
jgi:4-hydroxybenzoate polyprenyltransferase